LLSAITISIVHGSNDVGNAIGPLVVISLIYNENEISSNIDIPFWTIVFGTIAFAVGIGVLGYRTINTIGSSMTKLDPIKSYST